MGIESSDPAEPAMNGHAPRIEGFSARPHVVVIGAGISGLTAAFRLQERGIDVTVLEAEQSIGGRMSSVNVDGFTMNRAANILPASYHAIRKLAEDVGLGAEIGRADGMIATFRDGKVHRLRSDHLVVDGLRTRLLSWRSKARLGRALLDAVRMRKSLSYENLGLAARFDTQTAAEYCRRHLNAELEEYLVEPILRALYAAGASRLSIVDFFFAAVNFVGSGFLSYPGGIDFLVRAIAERVDVVVGGRAVAVERRGQHVIVDWEYGGSARQTECDGCVIAVPGPRVVDLYPQLDERQREILQTCFEYNTVFNAHYGLRSKPDEQAMIIQVPASEDPGLCVITFDHNSSPSLVPPGKGKLSAYWLHDWCEPRWDRDDAELLDEMAPSVSKVVPGFADLVEVTRIDRWRPAVLMSRPGVYAAVGEFVSRIDPTSPVQLAGDYLTASSTNGCAVSGELAALRLSSLLAGRTRGAGPQGTGVEEPLQEV